MYGLRRLLTRTVPLAHIGRDGFFNPPSEAYCSAGYWVAVAARARSRNLSVADLRIPGDRFGYAQALGIEAALNQTDSYPFGRWQCGANYSPLVVIAGRDDVDKATRDVSGCIRTMFPEPELTTFVAELCSVVGDLHDNVWSHGESTGISAAQRWAEPKTDRQHSCIEFALADCGRGFLGELNRSGVSRRHGITNHQDAIDWCLQKGHSSKKRDDDEWAQQLPEDAMGNPIGRDARPASDGNHHMGLGLFKLTSLVTRYGGNLWLASGDMLHLIDQSGRSSYIHCSCPWQGVALACRFSTSRVRQRAAVTKPDELGQSLLDLMGSPP